MIKEESVYASEELSFLYGIPVLGDIANLSGLTVLTRLHLANTSINSSIANLRGLTPLVYLHLANTSST